MPSFSAIGSCSENNLCGCGHDKIIKFGTMEVFFLFYFIFFIYLFFALNGNLHHFGSL